MILAKRALLLFVCLLWAIPSLAALEFPKLSGRVVDNAAMLGSAAEASLTDLLAGHERAATNQVVVVTLADLQGDAIESFGYQLARHWGVGQKGKDNGVLLIVAKKERKVRIEVGYGLEGQLTDAISANIIQAIIVPAFKRGQFESGIVEGAKAIVQALGGQYSPRKVRQSKKSGPIGLFVLIIVLVSFASSFFGGGGSGRGWGRRGYYVGGYGSSGHSSGGFGGGGFSGGGGSFGGGGASGGW